MMVEINYKIVIVAIVCLTSIVITQILCNKENTYLISAIVGAICLLAGVMLPQPKINNNNGVLMW